MNSQIRLTDALDNVLWNVTATEVFSCQSAYQSLHRQSHATFSRNPNWNCIWKSKLTNKMKHFLWLSAHDRLLTNSTRFKRKMSTDPMCHQCGQGEETTLHIVRHHRCAKRIWKEILQPQMMNTFEGILDSSWFISNLQGSFDMKFNSNACWPAVFTATIWTLWKSRNSSIFRGKPDSIQFKFVGKIAIYTSK